MILVSSYKFRTVLKFKITVLIVQLEYFIKIIKPTSTPRSTTSPVFYSASNIKSIVEKSDAFLEVMIFSWVILFQHASLVGQLTKQTLEFVHFDSSHVRWTFH